MSSRTRLGLLLFALLGLGASTASAFVHYRLLQDPQYLSVCDVSDTISCTQAYLSPYGALFGVPVAIFGVVWFVAVLALLVTERLAPASRENIPGYLFALSTAGLAVVLYLAYSSFFVLKAICILCVCTYLAVTGIFLISGAATSYPMTTLPRRALRDLRTALSSPVALTTLLLLGAGVASAIAFFPREAAMATEFVPPPTPTAAETTAAASVSLTADQQSEVEKWFASQPRAIVPVDGGGASVVIVKFNDYMCPPCRNTYEMYKPILAKYQTQAPGKVKFVTKDYPIDPECNKNTPGGTHMASCEAAAAVRMARDKGKGEALEDWLFANQQTLSAQVVRDAVRNIGGVADFDARYQRTLEQVKADIALGTLLGVRATPTFFINGVKIDGGIQPQFLDAIIAAELKKNTK